VGLEVVAGGVMEMHPQQVRQIAKLILLVTLLLAIADGFFQPHATRPVHFQPFWPTAARPLSVMANK
jgi:hypothetical protein